MPVGRYLLRSTVGGLFVGHGTQKLFGWFGGRGLSGTAEMMEELGLRPPKAQALAAGLAETGGGAGVALGLAAPLPNAVLIATMLTAIRTVHWSNGPWLMRGGWEYNAVLILAAAAVTEDGDRGPGNGALAALTLGAAGAVAAKVIGDRFPEPEPSSPAEADPQPPATAGETPSPQTADQGTSV